MKLLYTVSSGYLDQQSKPINSIGGFPSSTQIPNDVFSNLFDELSLSSIREAKTEYRAIILHNDSDVALKNVQLWFGTVENSYCRFQIGATLLDSDPEGNQYMERISDPNSRPYQTNLYPATELDKATIGDMEPNQMIGLWISREIMKEVAITDYNTVAERDLSTQSRYKPIIHEKEETQNFEISWD